jgi:hypothetical protein
MIRRRKRRWFLSPKVCSKVAENCRPSRKNKDGEDGDQNNPDQLLHHHCKRCTCLATPSENLCLMTRNKLLDFELSVVAPAVPIAKLPNDLSACNLPQQSGQRLA